MTFLHLECLKKGFLSDGSGAVHGRRIEGKSSEGAFVVFKYGDYVWIIWNNRLLFHANPLTWNPIKNSLLKCGASPCWVRGITIALLKYGESPCWVRGVTI